MAASPAVPGPDDPSDLMTESGSQWGSKQTDYFNVLNKSTDVMMPRIFRHSHKDSLINTDLREQLTSLKREKLLSLDHHSIITSAAGTTEKPTPTGTTAGIFFAFLAVIKQEPYEPDMEHNESVGSQSEPGARTHEPRARTQVQRHEFVTTDTSFHTTETGSSPVEKDSLLVEKDASSVEKDASPVDDDYAPSSQFTDEETHMRRVKPETPTQTLIALFLQLVFETSTLGGRGSDPAENEKLRLEWHIEGKRFRIDSPRVKCVSINDGSLRHKGYPKGRLWGFMDPLAYCSVETKARLKKWDDDGEKGSPDEKVDAQEASQLIGMMCERLTWAKQKGAVDPDKLTEYDRTGGNEKLRLVIIRTKEFDISDGNDLAHAADLILAMGAYFEANGPLMKGDYRKDEEEEGEEEEEEGEVEDEQTRRQMGRKRRRSRLSSSSHSQG
ncbi:hypothetical protein PRK78_006762 [Emydomyces testavorans]|uniref:Uncharacterized protein n=1 Tax=Emydomyces testavorans TaxID=2070801 RepID=A0AAF0IM40_9EURO|nr:hypothetical protein PRK78_006762 [Emydomyces testavorans]